MYLTLILGTSEPLVFPGNWGVKNTRRNGIMGDTYLWKLPSFGTEAETLTIEISGHALHQYLREQPQTFAQTSIPVSSIQDSGPHGSPQSFLHVHRTLRCVNPPASLWAWGEERHALRGTKSLIQSRHGLKSLSS